MKGAVILHSAFSVVRAGCWDASSFGVVDVEVRRIPADNFFDARLAVSVCERPSKPAIHFDADEYFFDGTLLRLRINCDRERWVFQALQ